MTTSALYTVELDEEPTVAAAARRLGVDCAEVDPDFGVVVIDPRRRLYAVRVTSNESPALEAGAEGPWSDPEIAPFGPSRGSPF